MAGSRVAGTVRLAKLAVAAEWLVSLAVAVEIAEGDIALTAAGKRTGALPVSFLRLVIACGLLMAYAPLAGGRPPSGSGGRPTDRPFGSTTLSRLGPGPSREPAPNLVVGRQ